MSSTPSSSSVASRSITPFSTQCPYSIARMLLRTDARYDSSSTSPKVKTTRPLCATTTPVELALSRRNAEARWRVPASQP